MDDITKYMGPMMMTVVMAAVIQGLLGEEPEPPPDPEPGDESTLEIILKDADGNILVPGSPIDIVEGTTGTLEVNVTNTSTRGGDPWAAVLALTASMLVTGGVQLLDGGQVEEPYSFGAGETHKFGPHPFTVPYIGGATGMVDALVSAPSGAILASASQEISILDIVWSALASLVIPSLSEGDDYSGSVAITNACAVGTTQVEVTLRITILGIVTGGITIVSAEFTEIFAGGETKSFTFPISVPWDTGGFAGAIDALIEIISPVSGIVGSDTEQVSIIVVPIDYGAIVVIG